MNFFELLDGFRTHVHLFGPLRERKDAQKYARRVAGLIRLELDREFVGASNLRIRLYVRITSDGILESVEGLLGTPGDPRLERVIAVVKKLQPYPKFAEEIGKSGLGLYIEHKCRKSETQTPSEKSQKDSGVCSRYRILVIIYLLFSAILINGFEYFSFVFATHIIAKQSNIFNNVTVPIIQGLCGLAFLVSVVCLSICSALRQPPKDVLAASICSVIAVPSLILVNYCLLAIIGRYSAGNGISMAMDFGLVLIHACFGKWVWQASHKPAEAVYLK